jgi:hypothetical protein
LNFLWGLSKYQPVKIEEKEDQKNEKKFEKYIREKYLIYLFFLEFLEEKEVFLYIKKKEESE